LASHRQLVAECHDRADVLNNFGLSLGQLRSKLLSKSTRSRYRFVVSCLPELTLDCRDVSFELRASTAQRILLVLGTV
jgi:hypothetical protein